MNKRSEFSSRFGFVMAAAGSAIGLGNIWGFPTQTAENGGGAFVFVYLILTFCLAYPVLMAELVIGRHGRTHIMGSLRAVAGGPVSRKLATFVAAYALVCISLILCFYSIVAGWMVTYFLQPIMELAGQQAAAQWLVDFATPRNVIAALAFLALTVAVISRGVQDGIEAWSSKLMPFMIVLIVALILYVAMQDGAGDGLKAYLMPDFSQVLKPELIINALGQAFFSLSLGAGTMMIYGSYVSRKENIVTLGAYVTAMDVGIAVLAGLLIIPAMYVAQHNGIAIFTEAGNLISGDQLVFTVLPALFDSLGAASIPLSITFFLLMSIAALTSSISMLEVPVAFISEHEKLSFSRTQAAIAVALLVAVAIIIVLLNFEALFGAVISFTTEISQPLIGLMFCLYAGWSWDRSKKLAEIREGFEGVEQSIFWKIWPEYVRYVCPLLVLIVYVQSLR